MIKWHIGCSGFHYKHWKGSFYPEDMAQSKWFAYYCQFFNTLELNVSFYRFPKLATLQNWHTKSPEGFRFAVKAPRAITHYRKFSGVRDMITDFYEVVREGLRDKLGCVLFQLPPNYHYSEERLMRITDNLDNSFLNVIEFRHESWWQDQVYETLKNKNITFCGMSHPDLPKDVVSNTPMLYHRMHGEGMLYASNYDRLQLQNLAAEIKSRDNIEEAYIFFNNDIHTYAVYNAQDLKKII